MFILLFVDSAGGLYFSGCFELVYCIAQGCFVDATVVAAVSTIIGAGVST